MNRFSIQDTPISQVKVIQKHPIVDTRGSLTRIYCADALLAAGWTKSIAQVNLTSTSKRGTVRGMHFQIAPHAEVKLVRCVAGTVHDVALDLRLESPTFKQSVATELSADNGLAMFLPGGIAHGFQTLTDNAALFYQMSAPYEPKSARGVRRDDAAFQIEWPIAEAIVCERDAAFLDFTE